MSTRQNLIVFACGRKNTGKSQLLHDLFVSRTPRVLSLDFTGETAERNPDAIVCKGWRKLMSTLKIAAGYGHWHIAAALEPDDIARLFRLLAPPFGDDQPPLARAFGGLAVECGEAYMIAPNAGADPDIVAGWRRGRHAMLSLYMAAQRPAAVNREVSAQADIIAAFAQGEPNDLDFLAKTISAPVAEIVAGLTGHDFVYYERGTGKVYVCGADRRPRRILNTMGAVMLPAGPDDRPAAAQRPAAAAPALAQPLP